MLDLLKETDLLEYKIVYTLMKSDLGVRSERCQAI